MNSEILRRFVIAGRQSSCEIEILEALGGVPESSVQGLELSARAAGRVMFASDV
ncbi:hypothetical protein MES5069_520156 [Mesorhizobium escarrei]|uniref:Uncharacterized protein n=1 Tax=Mesorhizobium escarrei TaxID=666018 RepID=A0ABM9EAW7_9HYPH|nr:hypothetical protein MES5069_520156 [Mesorhizobium escarrei]